MNWEHVRAFFWLYRRLRINQLKRFGLSSKVLLIVLAWGAVLLAGGLFGAFFLVGMSSLAEASPSGILYAWDSLALTFLFLWFTGLLTELQRTEVLSLDKFLHLPVSISGAFVINYFGALFCLSMLWFLPAAVGLSLGLAVARGPAMLLLLPLLAAFLLMVTALTHQFQGWLASLMVNKRRRRTIVVLLTTGFVLLMQVPNLVTNFSLSHDPSPVRMQLTEQSTELRRQLDAGEISADQFQQRFDSLLRDYDARMEEADRPRRQRMEQAVRLAHRFVPPGWLPLGAMAAAEGKWPIALLAMLGMAAVGTVSLWRSYTTTLRIYTGQFTSGRQRAAAAPRLATIGQPGAHMLDRELRWLPEQAAVIALSTFRSLLRAPEVKMLMLSSVLMLVIFGTLGGRTVSKLPEDSRPMLGFMAMGLILISMVQLVGNQFGFDRNGFQVFVLSGVRRRDILLGKNLAIAPLALLMGLTVASVLQIVAPMRLAYFAAVPLQIVSMYLLFCLLANCLSIIAPVRVPAGSLRGTRPGIVVMLIQMFFFLVVFPLTLIPTLLPIAIQWLLEQQGWANGIPVCLLLTIAEFLVVLGIYRLALGWQGRLLQAREQTILAIVRSKAE